MTATYFRRALSLLLLMSWAGVALGVQPDIENRTTYPVPPGVSKASRLELGGQTEQDYYSIEAAFPATPVLEHYKDVFAAWTACGDTDEWWTMDTGAPGQGFFLHKFRRQWMSPDNDRVVLLLFQYWSSGNQATTLPTNNIQMVSIVTTHVKDAAAHFASLSISCPNQPERSAPK